MKRRFIIALLILPGVIGLRTAAPVAAGSGDQAANPITLDVRVGFGGYVERDEWTPITVTVANDGEDITAELQVEAEGLVGRRATYTRTLELPRGSRKQVTLYVNDLSGFDPAIQVDLRQRNRTIAGEQVSVQYVRRDTLLIGVWSDTPGIPAFGSLGLLEPSSGEVAVATLTADDLPPQGMGWRALDVLIVSNVDSGKLSPDQREALEEWVLQGGRLIIVGGLSFQRTLSGLSDITPLRASSTQEVSLAPLGLAAGAPFDEQINPQAPVASGEPADDAQVLVMSGEVPLIVWRRVGYGRVDFLAADPELEPLRSWDQMADLWTLILADGEPRPGWAYGFQQIDLAEQAVAAVPDILLPSVFQLCGFLALYVILIGPVNYFVLQRLKRRELAWLTIPGLVLLFSALAYVTGFQLRGSQAVIHRLAVVHSWPKSEKAEVEALIGVWSPRRTAYDIQLDPGLLAHLMRGNIGNPLAGASEITFEEGEVVTLRGVRVDIGTLQPFIIEGFTANAPRISGNMTLTPVEGGVRFEGEILNASDVDLSDLTLIAAGFTLPLPDLPAGEVLPVRRVVKGGPATFASGNGLDPFPFANTTGFGGFFYAYGSPLANTLAGEEDCYILSGSERRRCNLAASILSSDGRGSGAYLTGWSEEVPFQTQVLNAGSRTVDMTLYIIEIDANIEETTESQIIEISPSMMTWSPLGETASQPFGTPYDLYLPAGSESETVAFRFEPIAEIPLPEVESLIVHLESPYPSAGEHPPQVLLWNTATGEWDRIQARWGDTPVEGPYVDSRGGVAIAIQPDQLYSVTLSRVDVTLLGQMSRNE